MAKRLALILSIVALTAFAGCGTATNTVTIHWPPNLGPPHAEALDTGADGPRNPHNGNQTLRAYHPKHGNAEQANFYAASGCGVERWAVKTLTDPGANQVNLTPQESTIADLASIAPPASPTDRVGPTETTTFRITGKVIVHKQEADSDIHIALEDTQGNHMIVEATAPSCAQGSVVLKQIEEVRPAAEAAQIGQTVTVTGVGFFDRLHGQSGVAPNGLELHPLLSIK